MPTAHVAPHRTVRRRAPIPPPRPPAPRPTDSPDSFDAETISAQHSPSTMMELTPEPHDVESSSSSSEEDDEFDEESDDDGPLASDATDDGSEDDDEDEDEDGDDDGDDEDDMSTTTTSRQTRSSSSLKGLKEIGNLASWTCSTAKPGNGLAQMRDLDTSLFWQSDGPQPHHINIHFAKRVKVKKIRLFLDFENDESYTPTKMVVLSGTGYQDLCEVGKLELERPSGWCDVELGGGAVHADGELRTHLVQVRILANHQNGKDTHVRGLQIFAVEKPTFAPEHIPFSNGRMLEEMEIR